MTGLLLGLMLGVGLFLVFWSTWVPDGDAVAGRREAKVVRRLRDDLAQAGHEGMRPSTVVAAGAIGATVVFVVVLAVSRVAAIALCFAAMSAYAPLALVRMQAHRRRARLRDLWPDVVDNVTSGVRAGLALPEALGQVAVRGPQELRPAFAAFAHDYRTSGRFAVSLDRLKDRLGDPVGDRLVESLRIAREVGGSDLGILLRTLSAFLREDARTRAELEARQSWTVNAARLAASAPWVVLAFLSLRPESVRAYATGVGGLVLLTGAVLTVVAYRLMVRIGRLPAEERVLR